MCEPITIAMMAMSAVSMVSQQKAMRAQQKADQARIAGLAEERAAANAQAEREKDRIKRAATLEKKRNMVIGSWYGWNISESPSLAATNTGIENALQREVYDIDYILQRKDAKYALEQRYTMFGSKAAWHEGMAGQMRTLGKAGATAYYLEGAASPAGTSSGREQVNVAQSGGY